jgi:aminoglycoside phosphotransferase (APT) family kinase protein
LVPIRFEKRCWSIGAIGDASTVPNRVHADELLVDDGLVHRLLGGQFPELADRVLVRVEPWGTDNGVWRLGDDLVVRLPRRPGGDEQVALEATWLPRLAPRLPVVVPEPIAVGEATDEYPMRWSVHRWVEGELAGPDTIGDAVGFAADLADVVRSMRSIPIEGAPAATNRARHLREYDRATRAIIRRAADLVDADAALSVWEDALAADPHEGPPVWVHGDLEGNCLVRDRRLSGLVDWGSMCAGDPAVDVQVVWSPLCSSTSRDTFLAALDVDEATVRRSRGAAIHQACAALPYYLDTYPLIVERSRHKLRELGVRSR